MTFRETTYETPGITKEPQKVEAPKPVTADDLLQKAADLIEQNGWTTLRMHRHGLRGDKFCAVGAIQAAAWSTSDGDYLMHTVYHDAINRLARATGATEHRYCGSNEAKVMRWNDGKNFFHLPILGWRGKKKVVRALREA